MTGMLLLSNGMEHKEIPSPSNSNENAEILSHQPHVPPFPFKLPASLLFTTPFTVATNKFKQKCQTLSSALYDHHTGRQMDVNSTDGTLSM